MKKLVVVFILLSLFSCKEIIKGVVNAGSNATVEKLDPSEYNEVVTDSLFELSLPSYMKTLSNLNDDASLQYANIFKETYTIVIYENKQDFIDSFKEYNEYDEAIPFIDNYSRAQTNFITEGLTNKQVIPYNLTEIGGLDARQIMMKGSLDGDDIGYVMGYVEGKENVYMIMTWTLLEKLNKYEETFEGIIGSFKLMN